MLDVDDHPACYQQAPALPGPPPNCEGQESRLAGQQSTACTPKRTPQRMASNTGAMAPYGCQTARRSGRKGLLTGCSPMAPASAASTAALTSPDRDQQYQYGSPAVRRPHTAAGTAGREETLAASADDASPSCPASAPPLRHLVVMNSAFSPQGGVVWGGGAVLQAWPVAHAAEEPPAAGKRPGLAPLRLAFSGEAVAAPAAAVPDSCWKFVEWCVGPRMRGGSVHHLWRASVLTGPSGRPPAAREGENTTASSNLGTFK